MKNCAILSMDSLDDFEAYDDLIIEPMKNKGWTCEWVSWREKAVDWDEYDAVVVRTPWDYQEDAEAFIQVLRDVDDSSAHLENNLATMLWNIDKAYLKELEQHHVNIVPSLWRDTFDEKELTTFFAHFGTDQIVLKPRVSANADNTFWVTKENVNIHIEAMAEAFSTRAFMIQPFLTHVVTEGEFSLFYFNGDYSHSILKTPKKEDFRVQEEHGGRLQTIEPEEALVACANQTLDALHSLNGTPLYARVDFVRYQNSFALMEAELIEPSLYFNMDPKAAERFSQAFIARMSSLAL